MIGGGVPRPQIIPFFKGKTHMILECSLKKCYSEADVTTGEDRAGYGAGGGAQEVF